MTAKTIGIVGTGLLGGSVALACKESKVFDSCLAYDIDKKSQDDAIAMDICDGSFKIGQTVDAVCVAVPTRSIASTVSTLVAHYGNTVPIFDVGSVKQSVLNELDEPNGVPPNFIPCHPIAGSEKNGIRAARSDLFENSVCAITIAESTNASFVDVVREIWVGIGCHVVEMDAKSHDLAVALTSHLPHLLSFVLIEMLIEETSETQTLVGNGFRDFSRIAAGEKKVWSDILKANASELSNLTKSFILKLQQFEALLNSEDIELEERIEKISSFRRSLHDPRSPSCSD